MCGNCFATTAHEILYPTSDEDVNLDPGPTGFDRVDELGPTDGVYVLTLAGSEVYDLYGFSDPINSGHTIESVKVWAAARYDVIVGTPAGWCKLKIKSGVTTDSSAAKAMTTTYAYYSETWATNPDTSAAWTWAEVASLQAGLGMWESRGDPNYAECICQSLYVDVLYTLPTGEQLWLTADDTTGLYDEPAGDASYLDIDETGAPDTSDYVYVNDNAVWNTDTYEVSNNVGGSGTINSVILVGDVKGGFLGSETGANLAFMVDMGGTPYPGAAQRAKQSNQYYAETLTENPDTSTTWTWQNIDDLKAGIGLKKYLNHALAWNRCHQYYIIVDYTEIGAGRRIFWVH